MSSTVCIMQPRLLPHLGYFALMSRVDRFVLFDSAQYVRREWINRNRIRIAGGGSGPDAAWRWLQVPVRKAPREAAIREIDIAFDPPWQDRLRTTLHHTYGRAPRFDEVMALIEPLWDPPHRLVDLLFVLLVRFADALDLAPEWVWSSEVEGSGAVPADPQERVVEICRRLGASTYWNLPGGRALYRPERFAAAGIELRFVPEIPVEALRREYAEASLLSIVDVAMYHPPGEIRRMLADPGEDSATGRIPAT